MLPLVLVLALAPAFGAEVPATSAGREDVGSWLERLGSARAEERERAQRWLGMHLESADYPAFATHARGADAETARRLALVLASEDRHLELAVLLLGEGERELAAIGRAAFDDLVRHWCPGASDELARRQTVIRALVQRAETHYREPTRYEELGTVVEGYDRLLDLGVPLVLSPRVAEREQVVAGGEGDALSLLENLCSGHELAYGGVGEWSGEEPGHSAWILIAPKSGVESLRGTDQLARWCKEVDAGGPLAAPSARALAATAWPAALAWLDRRWSERGDENALEGLLTAAARGRVGRSLQRAAGRAALLARADRALDVEELRLERLEDAGRRSSPSRRRAERVGRALVAAGPVTLGGGGRGFDPFEGWGELDDAQRWLRLHVVEGQGAGSDQERDFVRSLVEAVDAGPPALRFQALRALAVWPPVDGLRVAGLRELLTWAFARGLERELRVVLDSLDADPTAGELGAGRVAHGWLAGWWLQRGEPVQAARELRAALEGAPTPELAAWSGRLREWRRVFGPRLVTEAGRMLLQLPVEDRGELAEVLLLGGCLDDEERHQLFEALPPNDQLDARQLELLGALVVGRDGQTALERLIELLREPPTNPIRVAGYLRALDRAHALLVEAGLEDRRSGLESAVWERSGERDFRLRSRLNARRWPRSEPPQVVDLARLDPGLPDSLLAP